VHGVEEMEIQALKIIVAWEIKRLVKQFDDIFYEFQFSRQYKTCLSALILKQITIYSFMLTKTPGAYIENDANGTFDWVICGIALLDLCSIGFVTSVTIILGYTWSKHQCFIKTGFGVLDRFYQSMEDKQTFGLGKGSTSSTAIWCIMHRIIMHIIATYFIGIILLSVSGVIQHKQVGEGLIDDTGFFESAQSSTEIISSRNKQLSPDESALFLKIQKILQFFLELLQVAGGNLNITKCACFIVFHRWNGGNATLLNIQDSHPPMTIIHPHSGETKKIVKKDTNQAHRALGWMMTTDGKSTAQFKVMKQKSKVFAGAILQIFMQHYNATTVYNCYYVASISYTIAATRLSLEQCKTIQIPVVCATLNNMKINRNFARAIVFGPKYLGGMSLSHLHTLQGIRRFQCFIGHLENNYGVGKIMRIFIEATQREVRTLEPFLFLRHPTRGHTTLTAYWVNEIWSFLELFQATVTLTNS
jgi:hypothetical protein